MIIYISISIYLSIYLSIYIYIYIYTVPMPGGQDQTHDVVNPSYAEAVADGARVPVQDELQPWLPYFLQVVKHFR